MDNNNKTQFYQNTGIVVDSMRFSTAESAIAFAEWAAEATTQDQAIINTGGLHALGVIALSSCDDHSVIEVVRA